jgi:hypothetical protein
MQDTISDSLSAPTYPRAAVSHVSHAVTIQLLFADILMSTERCLGFIHRTIRTIDLASLETPSTIEFRISALVDSQSYL